MDLLIDSAKIGIGIAWVIRDFVEEDLKNGQLVEIKLPQPIEKRRIAFLYNSKNNSPSLGELWWAFLKKEKGYRRKGKDYGRTKSIFLQLQL